MQLSTQLYADIIGDNDKAAAAPPDERRRSPRAELGCRARVYPLIEAEADHGQSVLVRDLSLHGIGLLIAEPMTLGDEFVVHIPTKDGSDENTIQIQCAACRCQPGGSGRTQYLVGATFELVINRPISYAVHFPAEEEGDGTATPETTAEQKSSALDVFEPTPAELRYDELIAESRANLPQRESIVETLSRFAIARLIGRMLLRMLSPFLRIGRGVGLLNKDEDIAKIRQRLTAKRRRRRHKLTDLPTNGDTPAEAATEQSAAPVPPERHMTYAEQASITTLELASQFMAGKIAVPEAPPPAQQNLTGLERHVPLFAPKTGSPTLDEPKIAAAAPAEPMPAIAAVTSTSVPTTTLVAATAATTLPLAAPVVVPTFELPPIPTESFATPPPAITLPEDADDTIASREALKVTDFILQSIDPTLSVPKKTPTLPPANSKAAGPAWRSKHRSVMNQSPNNRRPLGR